MIERYQNSDVKKTRHIRIKIITNKNINYLSIPYCIYENIFTDRKNMRIELEFDCIISTKSIISYICDIVDKKKQLNIVVGDENCVEKYIISKHHGLKKYSKYCLPGGLSVDNFRIFENTIRKYGKYGDSLIDDYLSSEDSTNLYYIDMEIGIPAKYLNNRGIHISRRKKYNVAVLSKYKYVCYVDRTSKNNLHCFDIKLLDGVIYMRGPIEIRYTPFSKNNWYPVYDNNVYREVEDTGYGQIYIHMNNNNITWTGTYQYIMLMQKIDAYRDSCIKLKLQDDLLNNEILYIRSNILSGIDKEYFDLVMDEEYMEKFGDKDASIYFSENQTVKGFHVFLEHYLTNFYDLNNPNPEICLKSEDDIILYTYYHRFNLHKRLRLILGTYADKFYKISRKYGFDESDFEFI